MALDIRKMVSNPESSSTVMFVCGLLSLLASLVVAAIIMSKWDELGIKLGPRSGAAFIVGVAGGSVLACVSGIWALASVEKLTGRSALKCTVGYLLDAVALAIMLAFVIIAFFLNVSN